MRLLETFVVIAIADVGVSATACDCLAPAANRWARCAEGVLPRSAEQEALRLWEVRNQGHIDKSNNVDRAGEKKWLATWRATLARKCGKLANASRKDAKYKKAHIPGTGLDEIYLIAFGG